MAVRNEPCDQIGGKVCGTAMARMFNLQQVLELIEDRFQQGPAAQQHLCVQHQQAVRHVALEMRNEAQPPRVQQLARQRLRHIVLQRHLAKKYATLVSKQGRRCDGWSKHRKPGSSVH